MKKWGLSLLVIAILAIGSIYIFIPSTIEITTVRNINMFPEALTRYLSSPNKLDTSFKLVVTKKDSLYHYSGCTFKILNYLFNITQISISLDDLYVNSTLMPHSNPEGSFQILWLASIKSSINPFKRIHQYTVAKSIKKSMDNIMDGMKKYLDNPMNTYGIVAKEIEVSDSTLISTKFITNHQPTISEIYSNIKKLEDYAKQNQASTTNSPMLNSKKVDAVNFETMVALPINKTLTETKDIKIKRVPYKGKMFVTDITGGAATIKNAFLQMDIFVNDSKRSVVAIPFEMLITNRSTQTDTTKWVTRIYYPII